MANSNSGIPHIAVTTDSTANLHISDDENSPSPNSPHNFFTPTALSPSTASPAFSNFPSSPGLQATHNRSPSDPTLLSPFLNPRPRGNGNNIGLEVPQRSYSPAISDAGSSSSMLSPPSPTLSAVSGGSSMVHFAPTTSLALRENNPALLQPNAQGSHSRRPSWSSVGTEADPHQNQTGQDLNEMSALGLHRSHSATGTVLSATQTHVDHSSEGGGGRSRSHSRAKAGSGDSAVTDPTVLDHSAPTNKHKHKSSNSNVTAVNTADGHNEENGGDEDDDETKARNGKVALTPDDEGVDLGPFKFKPYALASMLDPKDLDALGKVGGTEGLLKGLGTHGAKGLGGGQGHDRQESDDSGGAYDANIEERRRVYGPNVLPHRDGKSLLQLMWLALKDKVLVSDPSFLS